MESYPSVATFRVLIFTHWFAVLDRSRYSKLSNQANKRSRAAETVAAIIQAKVKNLTQDKMINVFIKSDPVDLGLPPLLVE